MDWTTVLPYLAAVFFVSFSGGFLFRPGEWYKGLEKPWFTPPPWVFGPVWTTLYVMMALSAAFVSDDSNADPETSALALKLWWVQLCINCVWSALFFGIHRMDFAFVDVVLLDIAVVWYISITWHTYTASSLMFVPYIIWLSLATCLNWSVWRRNLSAKHA